MHKKYFGFIGTGLCIVIMFALFSFIIGLKPQTANLGLFKSSANSKIDKVQKRRSASRVASNQNIASSEKKDTDDTVSGSCCSGNSTSTAASTNKDPCCSSGVSSKSTCDISKSTSGGHVCGAN